MKVPGRITVNDYLYGRDVEPRVVLIHSIRDPVSYTHLTLPTTPYV